MANAKDGNMGWVRRGCHFFLQSLPYFMSFCFCALFDADLCGAGQQLLDPGGGQPLGCESNPGEPLFHLAHNEPDWQRADLGRCQHEQHGHELLGESSSIMFIATINLIDECQASCNIYIVSTSAHYVGMAVTKAAISTQFIHAHAGVHACHSQYGAA